MFLFSFVFLYLVHCFLIQTGRAGSHCKSIARSELRLNIKSLRVRDCRFVFCFQIHGLAYCTMNKKFSILHEAKLSAVLKISRSLYSKRVRVFENKTLTTVSFFTIIEKRCIEHETHYRP